jgi:hypothetical protein
MRRIVRAYVGFANRVTASVDESAWSGRSPRAKVVLSLSLVGLACGVTVLVGALLQWRTGESLDVWVPVLLALAWMAPPVGMIPFSLRRAMRVLFLTWPVFLVVFVFASWLTFRLTG